MSEAQTPIAYIRHKVFDGMSQTAFAVVAGATQATVSRWENLELEPDREQMARIREAARERGAEWDDRLFFEVPQESAA